MINDYLNQSDCSFMSDNSNEEAKIDNYKEMTNLDTKFPTPTRLSLNL